MSLFKLQRADERIDRQAGGKADRFSFFILLFLGAEVDYQKSVCNCYNNHQQINLFKISH